MNLGFCMTINLEIYCKCCQRSVGRASNGELADINLTVAAGKRWPTFTICPGCFKPVPEELIHDRNFQARCRRRMTRRQERKLQPKETSS